MKHHYSKGQPLNFTNVPSNKLLIRTKYSPIFAGTSNWLTLSPLSSSYEPSWTIQSKTGHISFNPTPEERWSSVTQGPWASDSRDRAVAWHCIKAERRRRNLTASATCAVCPSLKTCKRQNYFGCYTLPDPANEREACLGLYARGSHVQFLATNKINLA